MPQNKTTRRRIVAGGTIIVLVAAYFSVTAMVGIRETVEDSVRSEDPSPLAHESVQGHDASRKRRRVKGDPSALVIQREELPSGFEMAQSEPTGDGEFVRVYFNARALMSVRDPDPALFGVIANLSILNDAQAATETFGAQGGLDADSIKRDLRAATPGAIPKEIEPYPAAIDDVDRVSTFRVRYELQGTMVYEYRFRFVVGNALGNLIISARGAPEGGEPVSLRARAHAVVDRQVARLVRACEEL